MQIALDNVGFQSISRSVVIRTMQKQLYLDGSDEMIDYKDALKIKRDKTGIVMTVNYQREVPIIANVSLVVKFDNELVKKSSGS